MNRLRDLENTNFIILLLPTLLLIIIIHATTLTNAGASSTPKNLVNSYTNSPNDNPNNPPLTTNNSSQFQNEYQYNRQSVSSKASSNSDRTKSTTTQSSLDSPSIFEHLPNDLGNAGTLDYSYLEDKGTTNVPECKGRNRLTGSRGYITDGNAFYSTNLQCIWLIDAGRENATIRIQIHQFNTECNYDYLYIFDGDSIYSPLIAALSGDMKDFSTALVENMISNDKIDSNNNNNNNSIIATSLTSGAIIPSISTPESRKFEIRAHSGKAFIYFHSDTAQSMPGFYITYSVDSCPLDCSNRGECDYTTFKCRCNPGFYGQGCQHLVCPNNCTSPQHGSCDKEKSCICKTGFYGNDCSLKSDQQNWINLEPEGDIRIPSKAFHKSIVIDGIMYVLGGRTQALSNTNTGIHRKKIVSMIYSFDIEAMKWTDLKLVGTTGIDHLAELTGHSVAAKGNKIFIYGGVAMNNTILNTLTVFDTKTNTLASLINEKHTKLTEDEFSPPLAVVGHSANIIDSHMYIFLGYNPIYGYINLVQKFNLANNSWSFVSKKGSSIGGSIGHTSNYDARDGLVYIYGGHHSTRTNKLYSFDPNTEIWTFLQPGPSPRYYHTSVIVDRQLIISGGNSYTTSHQSDQCFQQTYLTYELSCTKTTTNLDESNQNNSNSSTTTSDITSCGRKCWQTVEDSEPGVMKRHGHSTVYHNNTLILFGGFNGVLMNDLRVMNLSSCGAFTAEAECKRPKLAINCDWNSQEARCEPKSTDQFNTSMTTNKELYSNCGISETRTLQQVCVNRETCSDCLNTNQGCVWCGSSSRCQYNKCKHSANKEIKDLNLCNKQEDYMKSASFIGMNTNEYKELQDGQDLEYEMECKLLDSCSSCRLKTYCLWQSDLCIYDSPNVISRPSSGLSTTSQQDDVIDMSGGNVGLGINSVSLRGSNSSRYLKKYDPFHKSLFATLTSSLLRTTPQLCELPCYMRRACNECTTTRCIWCSTSEQCIDSSAYFAYHAMGQCMHYVAHILKCPVATCAGIETCDKCLTNPKCGWLNDISNTGKGRCIEGTSAGPSFGNISALIEPTSNSSNSTSLTSTSSTSLSLHQSMLPSWFYTTCPSCQCNGHSYCRPSANSTCVQPCQDFTEGPHCELCIPGYFGDSINGGVCRPCECNGHAQSCHRETGKCYCSTKGITGHNCNRCDDQNHYIGDLSSQGNGTCYYNLTTDYQYTFNMSKPEDHFYSDINFINVPLRKDSDLDFTIACSRLALVNITSGTSFKNRKPIHTNLECGSFRLRFPHDRHILSESNYSFFVHVYKFQTPFILQIAFSQHRTLYLPQFFFTFSSCFLFFFALSGLIWKLKHEYDIYIRRQRQFIEMEQMASRPFSTVLLEMFKPTSLKDSTSKSLPEPTPIAFEPCFGNNTGVMSVFVQLPGRPNLAIGSALVCLNDEFTSSCDENKLLEKEQPVSV